MDRARIRRGRTVAYNPTAAEELANGVGPWLGMITEVNADSTVDLVIDVPSATPVAAAALADPLVVAADANANGVGYVQVDVVSIETLANANKVAVNLLTTLVNELRASISTRRASIPRGAQRGQYSLLQTGPQAL